MKKLGYISMVALLSGAWVSTVAAQEATSDPCTQHDLTRMECSPGTSAPDVNTMLSAIRSGSAERLLTTLEYGEQVECYECVPELAAKVLEDDNAEVREFAAWWLRRRIFVRGNLLNHLSGVLAADSDPVRRSRAAAALGEFMDPHSLTNLREAVSSDADASVRASAVSALGRLNHPGGNVVIAQAFTDSDAAVRLAALKSVMIVNFFRQTDDLIPLLADSDAKVRRETALLLGQRSIGDAADALGAVLRGDEVAAVRQAAAWALGRIGTSASRGYLVEAAGTETNVLVVNAIEVAQAMR